MNGGRTEYNNWEIDGGDNMDNGSNATLNVYPNPEAIAEVKVLTSNYGAQYGRNASGTVEVETKSGGSSFHGSAFEYLRNDIFNARSWDEGADPTQPKLRSIWTAAHFAYDVSIDSGRLYVAAGPEGVYVVDVSGDAPRTIGLARSLGFASAIVSGDGQQRSFNSEARQILGDVARNAAKECLAAHSRIR